jgi:hypothetical protein
MEVGFLGASVPNEVTHGLLLELQDVSPKPICTIINYISIQE